LLGQSGALEALPFGLGNGHRAAGRQQGQRHCARQSEQAEALA
jgi:hypothetical protein